MFSPLGSFSLNDFSVKPVLQSPENSSAALNATTTQISSATARQMPVAGPSTSTHLGPNVLDRSGGGGAVEAVKNKRTRTEEEIQIMKDTAGRFATCLEADHISVLYPDVDSPFVDAADVVDRLLPYHILQQPKDDLVAILRNGKRKGKEKATSDLRDRITETRLSLDFLKRRQALESRFKRVKLKSGKRTSPHDQAYILAQAVLEADRAETTSISSELRNARAELDKIQREKRMATMPPPRPSYFPQTSQTQYYRTYPYAYTQPYGGAQTATTSFSTSTFSTSLSSPSTYTPSSTSAIPVQLPVASLSALNALGIVPVPATSLPASDQPQPPAVLRGSTSNGTMLSLEINVSLLQSAQMSGLAMLLNSLMSRGVGANAATNSVFPLRQAMNVSHPTVNPQSESSNSTVHTAPSAKEPSTS
ncbi:hypothetical protein SERLA73DRAFT_106745 [Serpula lacrymans var. lacrymans S7.3]|uniref:GLTSCR protein conserved domain-containing protein n=2 Tax=Serpula lacrymans var. lacrymans TaxID=341189 RepID=F8PW22_SERL3|nr:uncharacterized protein SERLADRAFT_437193 [Serpula lacrymans var. lacrymans S7.9]EGN99881.1 hypothetical protein SERLA73DRAFT_106745 [Serpula lacrymans var. lacrymans S7.3]EGO25450.1 hypothetical protein SERLADRAFT_437193 [Serpula lacrymans var. lacrymans S7.9]